MFMSLKIYFLTLLSGILTCLKKEFLDNKFLVVDSSGPFPRALSQFDVHPAREKEAKGS